MAGNDWINSYLEAILAVDTGGINDNKSSLLLRERGRFSPAQYFVEEVITGFNETDLHRSWVRVRLFMLLCFPYRSQSAAMFQLSKPSIRRIQIEFAHCTHLLLINLFN